MLATRSSADDGPVPVPGTPEPPVLEFDRLCRLTRSTAAASASAAKLALASAAAAAASGETKPWSRMLGAEESERDERPDPCR
jgi:hypothetical protein